MKYTKPWTIQHSVLSDEWHQWLTAHAHLDLDHQLLYRNDSVTVEFFDPACAEQFAAELGL